MAALAVNAANWLLPFSTLSNALEHAVIRHPGHALRRAATWRHAAMRGIGDSRTSGYEAATDDLMYRAISRGIPGIDPGQCTQLIPGVYGITHGVTDFDRYSVLFTPVIIYRH